MEGLRGSDRLATFLPNKQSDIPRVKSKKDKTYMR